MTSPYEADARRAKAQAFGSAIVDHFGDRLTVAVADGLADMPADWWTDLAAEIGRRPPSTETQAMVISYVRTTARDRERFRDVDPFEGL